MPGLTVAPPAQFGGAGDEWSPEDLFMASIASCFILSFRTIARGSRLCWLCIKCASQGRLEKVENLTKFSTIVTRFNMVIPAIKSIDKAGRLLHKAE
ncbi:MAG: organic hydroperoxide reductase OsmC/OhrA [Paraglaciecola sp.]|jgi:organic hydroperoxide reductase OsmC/OhrA